MNVLAIGCHPDDLEIGCGGTLIKYVKAGHKTFMCHITNGDMGHKIIKPEDLGPIRIKEARKAAEIIGAEHITLNVSDNADELFSNETEERLIEVIRYTKPDIIITHNDKDYSAQHEATSEAVKSLSFAATVPHIITTSEHISNVPPIIYMDTLAGTRFIPSEYVDITQEIEQKLQALACHESQIKWMLDHDNIDFLDFVKTCSKFRGMQCGVPYAEAFRQYAEWPRLRPYRLLP
jgi:LmbE family N-acetylglucosaminyl deacetylase